MTILLVTRRTASWLRTAGERGWVVLTKDQRLRYRPLEIAALRASKARVFVLTAGNLRGIEIAAVFLKALPRIFRVLHFRARTIRCPRLTSGECRHNLIFSPSPN